MKIDENITMHQQDMQKVSVRQKVVKILVQVALYAFLILMAIIVLFPFYWMINSSLKTLDEYRLSVPTFWPHVVMWENYVNAFNTANLGRLFFNTMYVGIVSTILSLVITVLSAFAFARLEFKGKNLVFTVFLSLMMIPNELVVITNFTTITNLDLRNTFTGLILPSVTSVFYIYLLKENFAQIPDELYYAAKVDGTSDLKYLIKVMVPISKPTIVSIVILKIIECWNSYVWPHLITDDEAYYLVSNGIQEIRENGFGRENVPAMMAAVVAISIPLIIIFLVFRNQIMTGVSKSGTKG